MIDKKIGIIGCGNMGEAMLAGLSKVLDKSTAIMVSETDAGRRDEILSRYRIIVEIDNNAVVKYSDVIILAVKPKDFDGLLKGEVCCGISEKKLLISIAAGITTDYIEKIVGKDVPVVRAMPNMAASIGEAITAISAGSAAGEKDLELARRIFSTIGDVVTVEEKYMDAVTAISGSGPAYFFYMVESMIEAAKEAGLNADVSKKLILKTMLASAKLLYASGDSAEELRNKVTSKGGTTEAAFKVFESKKFKKIVKDAIAQARVRAKAMSGGKNVRAG